MSDVGDRFHYVYSSDLNVPVELKIGGLDGHLPRPAYDQLCADASLQHCITLRHAADADPSGSPPAFDIFVVARVYCGGRELGGGPVRTSYRPFVGAHRGATSATSAELAPPRLNWNEWLRLPVDYAQLSRDAVVAITVYDYHERLTDRPHAIGGTTLSLFSKRGVFRNGIYDLQIWPFQEADGTQPDRTPGKVKVVPTANLDIENSTVSGEQQLEMQRLSKLSKKHRSGLMKKVDWLDRLTFREIETINERQKRSSKTLYLMVEFPFVHFNQIEHSVVYFERNADELISFAPYPTIVTSPDPEIGLENIIEAKHHILARSARSGAIDRERKPNALVRSQLDQVLTIPPGYELTNEQRDLMWKFRYHLSTNSKALAKFLQSVQWDQENEVKQALRLMQTWTPMDAESALELLSPRFGHLAVRRYAVRRLQTAPLEHLLLYLLQLVQALKYEHYETIAKGTDASFIQDMTASQVVSTSAMMDESLHLTDSTGAADSQSSEVIRTASVDSTAAFSVDEETDEMTATGGTSSDDMDLATFLINAACKDATLANYFYWYLKVECDSFSQSSSEAGGGASGRKEPAGRTRLMYLTVLRRLSKALFKGGTEAKRRRAQLLAQQVLVERMVQIMKAVSKESGNRKRKIEYLQSQLTAPDLQQLNGLPLPLDPSVKVESVVADRASLFNSALMPCRLVFKTTAGRDYVVIFKHGDDLRQDQLVIQMIRLMDKLLQSENLDLKLTPYQVLATSLEDGFIQFVESQPLSDVIAEWKSIQEYLRYYRPSKVGAFGIDAEVLDNYVRSLAGYSVLSYLLGIGDRHLHNLLLAKNGRLFHVDFGYILGRDPKPLPPPMKLTREMVDAMGGGELWQQFRNLCYTAFLHLRRHANLVLNLFSLTVDASIPDIAIEPDKAVRKLEERFHLHLSEEEAVQAMQQLLDASLSAKVAVLADIVHDWAHILRN